MLPWIICMNTKLMFMIIGTFFFLCLSDFGIFRPVNMDCCYVKIVLGLKSCHLKCRKVSHDLVNYAVLFLIVSKNLYSDEFSLFWEKFLLYFCSFSQDSPPFSILERLLFLYCQSLCHLFISKCLKWLIIMNLIWNNLVYLFYSEAFLISFLNSHTSYNISPPIRSTKFYSNYKVAVCKCGIIALFLSFRNGF